MTAALALLAARAGKRVLAIDVDAKGDLAAALGSPPAGFAPRVVQHNLSVLELRTDESFQEYLNIYFKVPRVTRLTPARARLRLHRHRRSRSARHARGRQDRLRGAAQGARTRRRRSGI